MTGSNFSRQKILHRKSNYGKFYIYKILAEDIMTNVSKRFLLILIIVVLAITGLIASVLIAVNSGYFNLIPNTSTAPTDDNPVITIQSPKTGQPIM